jgi:hypothetical protein
MPKLNTSRQDSLQDRQPKSIAEILNGSQQSFETVLDFSICGGGRHAIHDADALPERAASAAVVQASEADPAIDEFFSLKPPHGSKRSRKAVKVATHLSIEHHGSKETSTNGSPWVFEHRWPHRRDRAEGRNHRIPSK